MTALAADTPEPCPHCGSDAALAARACPHCRRSLLLDLIAAGGSPPREAYAAARELAAGGLGLDLHASRRTLERGGTLLTGATRSAAAGIAAVATRHGASVSAIPSGAAPATPPASRAPARRHAALWAAGSATLLAVLVWSTRDAPPPPESAPRPAAAAAAPAPGPAAPLSARQIGALAAASTVALRCGDSAGSGFFVAPDLVVTNAHVLCADAEPLVRHADGRELRGTVEHSDPWLDVALVRVSGAAATPLPLGDAAALRQGDAVYFYGSPRGLDFTLSRAIVGHNGRALRGIAYVQIDGNVNPGNSGGPLLDDAGHVVGIVTMMVGEASGLGLALPVNYLYEGEAPRFARPAGADTAAWGDLVRTVAAADERDAEQARRQLDRPALVAAVVDGEEVVAVVVQPSRAVPFSRRLSFAVERAGSEVCHPTGSPEAWRQVGELEELGIDVRTLDWLRRHQLEGQVWTATVPLDWFGCPPPPQVLGWELALAGAPSGADRAPIALVLPW